MLTTLIARLATDAKGDYLEFSTNEARRREWRSFPGAGGGHTAGLYQVDLTDPLKAMADLDPDRVRNALHRRPLVLVPEGEAALVYEQWEAIRAAYWPPEEPDDPEVLDDLELLAGEDTPRAFRTWI